MESPAESRENDGMEIFALVIAVLALVVSAFAFNRTGGIGMLRHEAEEARRLAANALGRVEGMVRPHGHVGDVPAKPKEEVVE